MDPNYSFSLLSFIVGILAGFQFIAQKYRNTRLKAALTLPGLAYLFVRGLVASITFVTLYILGVIQTKLALWALVTGAGAEVLLRTKVFVGEKRNANNEVDTIMLGPLDLLVWFQNLFVDLIGEQILPEEKKKSIAEAKRRSEFLDHHIPPGGFESFCQTIETHFEAFGPDSQIFKDGIAAVKLHRKGFDARIQSEAKPEADDEKFKKKLGYALLYIVGEEGFPFLVSGPPPASPPPHPPPPSPPSSVPPAVEEPKS